MNYAAWFMVIQGFVAFGGAVGFGLSRQWPLAFVWACYAAAQMGWTWQALR